MVDEELTHGTGGGVEEVRSARPRDLAVRSQLQVGLVDQRRGLQRVSVTLAREEVRSHATQLVMDGRVEFLSRAIVPFVGASEQSVQLRRQSRHGGSIQSRPSARSAPLPSQEENGVGPPCERAESSGTKLHPRVPAELPVELLGRRGGRREGEDLREAAQVPQQQRFSSGTLFLGGERPRVPAASKHGARS